VTFHNIHNVIRANQNKDTYWKKHDGVRVHTRRSERAQRETTTVILALNSLSYFLESLSVISHFTKNIYKVSDT
jgi:hypothetical protein